MSTTEPACQGHPAVRQALCEDAAGCGLCVDASLSAQLDRASGRPRPLPPRLASVLEEEFAADLGPVRLHVGGEVDRLAAGFGARAFCVGTDVYLAGTADHGSAEWPDLSLLRHELAHIVRRVEPQRIRFWNGDVHAELTQRACEEFGRELDQLLEIPNLDIKRQELIKGLKTASSNMDFRKRVWHPLDTAKYAIFNAAFWVAGKFGAHYTEGEGPRHGEGLNYSTSDWAQNRGKNLEEQKDRVDTAVKWFTYDREHQIDDAIPTARTDFVSLMEKEWVKSLGDAFHVAQDRGSHREGVKRYGHDDPRCLTGWSPDEVMHDHRRGRTWDGCSAAAFNKALNNSYEVLAEFLSRVGIRPHVARMMELTCTTGFETTEIYFSPYPNPANKSVLGRTAVPHGYCGNDYVRLCLSRFVAAGRSLPRDPPYGRA